jgi:hypothetical protein
MSAHHIHNLPLLSTQPPDSFQNGQVSLTRPVLFQTLTSAYADAPIGSDAPRERVNQGRLADARFSCHKYDLPFSSKGLLKPRLQP